MLIGIDVEALYHSLPPSHMRWGAGDDPMAGIEAFIGRSP